MKIRQGFVSNSSSSSFIVPFPKGFKPSAESVQEYLFKGMGKTMSMYDYTADVALAASTIATDMLNQVPNNNEKLISESRNLADLDIESFKISPQPKKGSSYDWDAYEVAINEASKILFEAFKKKVGNDVDLYVFEFSDNDGQFFCVLEHGGTFDNVEHLRISHH